MNKRCTYNQKASHKFTAQKSRLWAVETLHTVSACGDNEEYNSCGTACPLNCNNRNENIPCTDNCVEGCFCKEGFILNKEGGNCIPEDQCPIIIGPLPRKFMVIFNLE